MEIFSVDSADSSKSWENKKNPVAKYYLMWDLTLLTSDFPAMQTTTELLPRLLLVSNIEILLHYSHALLTLTKSSKSKNH